MHKGYFQSLNEFSIDYTKVRITGRKLFRGDKSYLGNKAIRVQSDESAEAKIFKVIDIKLKNWKICDNIFKTILSNFNPDNTK